METEVKFQPKSKWQ